MERYEMAELLSGKAGVSLEEARTALVENDWDMLDAMVALERKRNAGVPTVTVETGADGGETYSEPAAVPQPVRSRSRSEHKGAKEGFGMLWYYIKRLFRLSVENDFIIIRNDKPILTMPVLALVALLVFCFWVTLPLLVIGLFFGCSYRFEGRMSSMNKTMEKIENVVENVKETLDGDGQE